MDAESQSAAAQQAVEALERAAQRLVTQSDSSVVRTEAEREASRARRALAALRLELRSLREEDGLFVHSRQLCELDHRLRSCQSSMDLGPRVQVPASNVSDFRAPCEDMSLQQAMSTAHAYQDASKASVQRSKKLALQCEEVGICTLGEMHKQEETLERIDRDIQEVKQNVSKSKKLVRSLAVGALKFQALLPGKRSKIGTNRCSKMSLAKDESMRDFYDAKEHMYVLLDQVRGDIFQERQQSKRGNVQGQTSQNAQLIEAKLLHIESCFATIQTIHKKAPRAADGAASRDIQGLRQQIGEVRQSFMDSQLHAASPPKNSTGVTMHSRAPASTAEPHCELNHDEQRALESMRKRDLELEAHIAEIGKVVDRVGQLAQQIGSSAERQKSKADALLEDADLATGDVKALSEKVKLMLR